MEREALAMDALRKVKRFADHAEQRQVTVPLWAGLLWHEAITAVNAALAQPVDERVCGHCGGSMEHKMPQAKYCKRECQEKAYQERRAARPPGKKDRTHLRDAGGRPFCGVYGFMLFKTDQIGEVDCEHCLTKMNRT